ncbi:MAG TPA: TonB family protein [Bryobacteraceae bacterium]|nr:TonB family protein [Bryobacteraceae bacterium]
MTGGVLARPDPMGRSFAFAVALHLSLLGAAFVSNLMNTHGERFGDPNAGGASVGVEAVDKIPLPHSGPQNPVAHDSESEAPQAPAKTVEREKDITPPDAVKLNLKQEKKKPAKEASRKRLKSFEQLEANQLTSTAQQQVSSSMYSQMPGSGRVGTGMNTTLGTRFGAYAQQIQTLIAQHWNTGDVKVQTGPLVIARFDLMRDGSIRNLTLLQNSGISSLDFSVRRAIESAAPFPPIPPGFDQSYARCEFTFELKK